MGQLFSHLFSRWLEDLIGYEGMLGGMLMAMAFWSLDYGYLWWAVHRGYAVLCVGIGIGIGFMMLLVPMWTVRETMHIFIGTLLFYVPLRIASRRLQTKGE